MIQILYLSTRIRTIKILINLEEILNFLIINLIYHQRILKIIQLLNLYWSLRNNLKSKSKGNWIDKNKEKDKNKQKNKKIGKTIKKKIQKI